MFFLILSDGDGILTHWRRLTKLHGSIGKHNHDAHLVAAMLVYGISSILTFNKQDFVRYPEISAITPPEVLAGV